MNNVSPGVVGNAIKKATTKVVEDNNMKVLVVKNPEDPITRDLYYADKEDVLAGFYKELDITEAVFNNPKFDTSYNDLIPGTWKGLPNMNLLGESYNGNWVVDYHRNPNKTEDMNGTQIVTSFTGKRFIRYGLGGVWQRWQLLSSTPFGQITTMLIPNDKKPLNNMGWVPLNGFTHNKKKYPDLYEKIKNVVVSNADSFTLPNLNDKYLTQSGDDNKTGTFKGWTIPNIDDEIGFIAGAENYVRLIRAEGERDRGLFQVDRRDDTTTPYLNKNSIINPITGDPIVGDGSGLTTYLQIDTEKKLGADHVSDKVAPDTFYVTGYYIYAGYPQVD